jgi:hypothetical protein
MGLRTIHRRRATGSPRQVYASFNGTSSNVLLPTFTMGTTRTIAARFYSQTGGSQPEYLLDFVTTRNVFSHNYTGNLLAMHISPTWHTFGAAPLDNAWHTIVFLVNGTEGKCYLDGNQSGSTKTIASTSITASARRIGSQQSASSNFAKMRLRKFVIDSAVWSEAQITTFHQTQAHSGTPAAVYLFNEGTGQTISDSSGNANHGTGTDITWGVGPR